MDRIRTTPAAGKAGSRGGFTLIEILFAVAVVGILIGLLVVGLTMGRKVAAGHAGATTVAAMKMSSSEFSREFGVPIPLIKDYDLDRALTADRRFPVYVPALINDPEHKDDAKFLRHEMNPALDPNGKGNITGVLPAYWDLRYSLASLPVYLVGVDETPLFGGAKLPIDGAPGPGIIRPNEDGTFQIPESAKKPNSAVKRAGQTFGPFLDTGRSGARIVRGGPKGERFEIQDSKGIPIRYYRWLQGKLVNGKYEVKAPADMNVPKVVGDPEKDPALRGATSAIVWCGPDGLYGDEPIKDIRDKLNIGDAPEAAARDQAITDNVVEVLGT